MTKNNDIAISKEQNAPLSKEQKTFNRLNAQIKQEKELLLNWQDNISEFKNIYMNERYGLQKQYAELRLQIVYLIDKAYDNNIFTKTERKKMLYIIEDIAHEFDPIDPKIKEIYNRRCDRDFDREQEIENEIAVDYLKSSMARDFDIDLDHIDADNVDDFMAEFRKHMEEHMNAQNEWQETRKENAKARDKEAKIIQKNKEVNQSIKDVYRQLVKSVHPDRETNLDEQVRKTELMQKINTAYNKNDLLTLLQMKLDVEQIELSSTSSIQIDKIKHYNIVLKNQLQEIKEEISSLCLQFESEFNRSVIIDIKSPHKVVTQLKYEVKDLAKNINELKKSLKVWKDNTYFKAQLKGFIIPNGR